jgi:ACR3 family arsenite transporter
MKEEYLWRGSGRLTTSGATLATVAGVLVEVPVMLHLVSIMKKNKAKFQFGTGT